MKTKTQIPHGEEGHVHDMQCPGYAEGGTLPKYPGTTSAPPSHGGGSGGPDVKNILAILAAAGIGIPALKIAFGGSKEKLGDVGTDVERNIGSLGGESEIPMMAGGGAVDPESIKESPIIEMLREFTMKHSGTGGTDQKDVDLAMNVDPSSGTAKGYAEGGVVDAEEENDPSIVPEEIKELVDKAHKEQRESRPDENWRITPPEKPESIAPYKQDEEDTEEEPSVLKSLRSLSVPNFAQGGEVPGYADGGGPDIGPSLFDVDGGDSDTIKMGGQGVPPPPAPVPAPNPGPIVPKAAPVAPMAAPAPEITASPTSSKPALTDEDFMARANNMLGLDPSQQASFLKLLGHNSQKAQIGAGIAGIGDAIASGGTLGKVNPGALAKSEDLIQGKTREGIEGMQMLRGNQEKTTDLSLKLQAQDPKSPLSRYAQKAYGGLGKKLGLDLSNASAAVISDITGKGVSVLNDEAELALKQASLGLQEKQVEATTANQQAERRQTDVKNKLEHPIRDLFGLVPSTTASSSTATGPYGPETKRNGKTYEWSAATGKYHLKQ